MNEKTYISEGTYGRVYKITHMGISCAKKIYRKVQQDDSVDANAIVEVGILSQICHPHVMRSITVNYNNNSRIECIMPLADETLREALKMSQIDNPIKLFYQICLGVQALHHNKLIHGDLSSRNILIKDGNAIITDLNCVIAPFTIAKWRIITCSYYRAPEVAYGDDFTNKIDIWSLGCIFHELMNRRHDQMFKSCNTDDDLIEAYNSDIIPLHDGSMCQLERDYLYGGISEEHLSFLKLLLQMNPSMRPSIDDVLKHSIFTHLRDDVPAPPIKYAFNRPQKIELSDTILTVRNKIVKELFKSNDELFLLSHKELKNETELKNLVAFTAVDIFDRVLCRLSPKQFSSKSVTSSISSVCLFIACKLYSVDYFIEQNLEIFDFADSAPYWSLYLLALERTILSSLNYRIYRDTLYTLFPHKHVEIRTYLCDHLTPENCTSLPF